MLYSAIVIALLYVLGAVILVYYEYYSISGTLFPLRIRFLLLIVLLIWLLYCIRSMTAVAENMYFVSIEYRIENIVFLVSAGIAQDLAHGL